MNFELKKPISITVQDEVKEYREKSLRIDGGYFSQYNTIRRINLYINSQYLERNADAEGLIFWNISTPRIIHVAKNIDLDTKDLMPFGKGNTNYWQAWILKLKFKKWLKDNHFSLVLNDLSEGVATYGSIIWKKYTDPKTKEVKLAECDLRRLAFKSSVKSCRDTNIVEMHYLTETEIREKEGAWDNIDLLLKNAKRGEGKGEDLDPTALYEVWERVGEVIDTKNKVHYTHYIGGGYGEKEVIAYEEEIKREENPYYDFHIGRYRGRWLRVGVVERLFYQQERANTLVNQNAESTQIASLLLMRSNDPNTYGNVLQGAISGQIINSTDLQQVGIDNRAFNVMLGELDRIEKQADALCFTPAVITGDKMPASIPFRGMATMANAAKSAFQYIRETIGETVSNLLTEEILPSIVKGWNRGGIIDMIDDMEDIKLFDEAIIKSKQMEVLKKNLENGIVTTTEQLDLIAQEVSKMIEKQGRKIEIPKGFFNFDYGISLDVVGEAIDKNQQNDVYAQIIPLILQNPAIKNDPYFRQWVENNGISPTTMTVEELNKQVEQMKQSATGQQAPQPASTDQLLKQVNSQ
jgi:hypothetical protein